VQTEKIPYGIKKSPRMWKQNFDTYILILGFVRSNVDHYIYSKEEGGRLIYVSLYVDDMLLIGNNINPIKELKKKLSSKFDMKYLGAMNFIMGMEIKRYQAYRNIWLNQMKYIETILKRLNMQNFKPVKVSIPMGERIIIERCPRTQEEIEDMAHVPYAIFVGSLMYVMVFTRQGIVHVVRVLSRYISTLGKDHWTIVKRVFRYLCGTKYYAICYQGKPGGDCELNVHGFMDVD
jgi:hypothetical protein